jgi:ATP-dependent Clp protease adapter protein ClpS
MENGKSRIEENVDISLGKPHKVILFNDECHSMEEVVTQIMQAVHCSQGTAFAYMMEAHNTGRAVVFTGGLERCELVSSVLEEIRLSTKIEPA